MKDKPQYINACRLSPSEVEEQIKRDGPVLVQLRDLKLNVARVLAKHRGDLILSLDGLTDSAAVALSKHEWHLGLYGLKSIGPGVAKGLSKYRGELSIDVESLSIPAAKAFRPHEGRLNLGVSRSLSTKAAEAFAEHEGDISLGGHSDFSDAKGYIALAAKLASQPGTLDLGGVRILSDPAAEVLATHRGDLILSGLSSGLMKLSVAESQEMGEQPGRRKLSWALSDDNVSENALRALAERPGNLDLSGLNDLSVDTCEHFASHDGELRLMGLKSLSDKAVESLAKHRGALHLPGWPQMTEKCFASTRPASHKFQNLAEAVKVARRRLANE